MRILLCSDAPFQSSGYGQQVNLLVPRLMAAGHEVVVYAPSYWGEEMLYNGITVIGGNQDNRGELMAEYAQRLGADIIMTLKNLHVYHANTLRTLPVPWVPVIPVETEPMSATDRGQASFATVPFVLSRIGQQLLAEEGIRSFYTPHGIDTAFWTPGDRQAARRRWNISDDTFVAAFVGVNDRRKNIDQLLIAWASFVAQVPLARESVLLLHTMLNGAGNGKDAVDIDGLMRTLDISTINVRVADQLGLHSGVIPAEYVRDIYRAADVLLLPSRGEGFGLPAIEAQSCGCPVITTQWTAMRETNWSGWQVNTDRERGALGGEIEWNDLGGFWFRASQRAIYECIKAAFAARGDDTIRQRAADGAAQFNIDHVVATHWLPALERVEALINQARLTAAPGGIA